MKLTQNITRAGAAVIILATILLVAGCLRYGPERLVRRAQSEIAARKPHPQQVPTPLSVVQTSGDQTSGASLAAAGITNRASDGAEQVPAASTSVDQADGAVAAPLVNAPEQSAAQVEAAAEESRAPAPTPPPFIEPTATPPLHQPAQSIVRLSGFHHEWQTWNNCGPATLAMHMSYFGSPLDQADIGGVLRTNPDDKNVSPYELAAFAQNHGYHARTFVNGDVERLKVLLSNGLPVLVHTWLEDDPGDGMGHYRLLTGFDDANQHWIAYDSYQSHHLLNGDADGPYQGIALPYVEFEPFWNVFNRTYLLLYTDAQAPLVESIQGDDMNVTAMWQRSYHDVEAAVTARPDDAFAWFNLGTSLTALGDYAGAAMAYDQARQIGLPWRMLWYQFGPFEAYYEIGRYHEVVALADATIATTTSVEELYYWKGRGLDALGDLTGARRAWQRAVDLNPNYAQANQALATGG